MKSLLLLVLLSVSGLSFSATNSSEEIQLGERTHLMTGAENCDGTTDYNSESSSEDQLDGSKAIKN
ncbi:MAG: hypothetical protein ACJAS4_000759 [Bacteriovoracaceae bacterium]|jgi:hypothetical protein